MRKLDPAKDQIILLSRWRHRLSMLVIFWAGLAGSSLFAQETGAWKVEAFTGDNPEKRHESAFVQVGNKFYLLGGRNKRPIQAYDPATRTWSNRAAFTNNIHHFQGIAYAGKIYIIGALTGGYPAEDPVPNVLIYDPAADQLITGAAIPANRQRGSAGVVLYNNKFYVIAGNRNGHSAYMEDGVTPANVAWFDEYDPASDTWRTLPDAPHARDHFQAAVIGERLYVAAGRRSQYGGPGNVFNDTEAAVDVYDFKAGKWLSGSDLPQPIPTERAGTAVAVLGNEMLVIGGEVGSNPPDNLALRHTEALNVNTGQWRTLGFLNVGRHASQAVVHNGLVYLPAGSRTRGGTEIAYNESFLEVFDSKDGSGGPSELPNWTEVGHSNVVRVEAPTINYGNELYFFNGFHQELKIENSTEKYNPESNTWKFVASMPLDSNGQVNAVTHNGIALVGDTVWIVGGRIGDHPGEVTDEVWLYDISKDKWTPGPSLPMPGGGGGVGRLGRTLHYVGGFDTQADCDVDVHFVLDLNNIQAGWQDWTDRSPLPDARNHFGTVVLNGRLYVVGGQHGHDGCQAGEDVPLVHYYDPVTDKWTRVADFFKPQSHMEPSIFPLDGKIYVVGGQVTGQEVVEYDPVNNQWKILQEHKLPRRIIAPGARVMGPYLVVANGGSTGALNPIDITMLKSFQRTPKYELGFHPGQLTVNMNAGETRVVRTILYNEAGEEETTYSLNTGSLPGWLGARKTEGKARESFEEVVLTFNTAGLAKGTYTFDLTASAANYTSGTLRITLKVGEGGGEPNQPPVAVATVSPNIGTAPLSVTLDGRGSTDSDGNIVSYAWNWDENGTARDAAGSTASVELPAGLHVITLTVTDDDGASAQDTASVRVSEPCGSIAAPWATQDIGAVGAAGSACVGGGKFRVMGSGADIWGGSDEFQFVHQPIACVAEVIARVESLTNTNGWAKAGIMIREGLSPSARHVMMVLTPSRGANLQYRATPGGPTVSQTRAGSVAPMYVRLVRDGNIFTGYTSPSGAMGTWQQVGSVNISMAAEVLVGLAVTSHNDGVLTTAEFSQVQIRSCPPSTQEGIVSLTLINADTDTEIGTLTNGAVIDLNQLGNPRLDVRANTNPSPLGSVRFELTGPMSHTRLENTPEYAMFGNSGSNYHGRYFNAGMYTLKASSFTAASGGGTAYPPLTVQFEVRYQGTQLGNPNDVEVSRLSVHPNPATDMVYVTADLPVQEETLFIEVIDQNAQRITLKQVPGYESNTVVEVPIGNLPAGLYIIQVRQGNWWQAERFVKK